MQIFVARQPVFDRHEQLFGYDLVLRSPGESSASDLPPEQLVADTFLGIGINQVAGGRRAFLAVDREMLLGGAVRLLPPDRVVLEIDGRVHPDAQLIDVLNQLAWSGYRFSVVSESRGDISDELLRLAEIVKVDIATTDSATLPELARWLRSFHVRMLAVHVRHRVERDRCTALGFELFEGYRFIAAETLTRRDLPVEHVATFRLLKMTRDPNVTDVEIEEVFRRDVALSYKLLRMVNSAAVGGRDIWSIGHALRLLGRDQVGRWLGLMLVTDGTRIGVRGELMNIALVRARMCELLADGAGVPRARGPLFLVGMLSVLDHLLQTPMETLADSIDLAPELRAALLHREEFYGEVLGLVEAYEQGWWDQVDQLAPSVGVTPEALGPLYLESLEWASEHQRRNNPERVTVSAAHGVGIS